MTVSSYRLTRNLVACLLAAIMLSGCSNLRGMDLNPFGQKSESAATPVPVAETAGSTSNPEDYPVRQPPPPPRDGMSTAPAQTSSMIRQQGRSPVKLRPDAPQRYTVVKGDTLWDISGLFLQDPWYWPEIWQVNPQIENPHLIYPGDVLSLVWVDGVPQIQVNRTTDYGMDRRSPQIRVLPLESAIPVIPYEILSSFLSKPQVLPKEEAFKLPYILDIKESHIVAGSGFTVYTRGADFQVGQRYNVMHIGDKLYDPDDGRLLGYQMHYVGAGRVTQGGDPAKFFLNETSREALRGDRLIVQNINLAQDFLPSSPDVIVDGRIVSVVDGLSLIGNYQIVVLNRGHKHGVRDGNVLSIFQDGRRVKDPYARRGWLGSSVITRKVDLPDEEAGRLLVFRTQEDISFGLVMNATSEIKVHDHVVNPR
ncbi:MAG: LysM peptidoglycan-binding domain-containing protein [Gammaproteobacteria bacterium]|nr:LysM peptidoglycan-binding domain-containing protein [Gammaproteobacteria bacterium]